MQILPATAYYLAQLSGGQHASPPATSPRRSINVAYGSYYLRYLLDHYDGDEMLAVAAYNGGPGQRRPLGRAGQRAKARQLTVAGDPVPGDARIRPAGAAAPSRSTAPATPSSSASTRPRPGAGAAPRSAAGWLP